MARPSELTEQVIGRASAYLDTCRDNFNEKYKTVELPSVEGLARFIGVSRQTIYSWKDTKTEIGDRFLDIYNDVMDEQAKRLINNGLAGNYTPAITAILLSKHGHSLRSENDITSKGEKIMILPAELINKNATPSGTESNSTGQS